MSFTFSWTDVPEQFDDESILQKLSLQRCDNEAEPGVKVLNANALDSNILIKGDNYPVLKLLKNEFAEKINIIYIDPPYNTGNNF